MDDGSRVVNDVRYSWIVKEDVPTIYRSFRQTPPNFTTVVLRTAGDPLKFVSAARAEIAVVDANLPLYDIKPMDKVIRESIVGNRVCSHYDGGAGSHRTGTGIGRRVGVMSYAVSERTHEIGIRMSMARRQATSSLGAAKRDGTHRAWTGHWLACGIPAGAHSFVASFRGAGGRPGGLHRLPLLLLAVAGIACYLPRDGQRTSIRSEPCGKIEALLRAHSWRLECTDHLRYN